MKPITVLLAAGLGVLLFAGAAQAQAEYVEPPKLRSDKTYSTHNYKHPNKAATARRWEAKQGVAVQQLADKNAELANYKRQMPNAEPVGGVSVSAAPLNNVASGNYKMQRPSSPATVPDADIARKRSKKDERNETTGN